MDVIGFLYVSPGSSTVQLRDSLGSRRACRCSKDGFNSQNGDHRMVSVVKMATVLEAYTTEEQRSFVPFFYGQNDSMQRIFIKKYFLFTVGSICRVKPYTNGSRKVANVSLITKGMKRRCGSG
jgi:hypothetical protein